MVAHVRLHALGSFADRLGLGDALSARIPITGERLPLHDRGKVLVSRCSCSPAVVSAVATSSTCAPRTTSSAQWLRTPPPTGPSASSAPTPVADCGRRWPRSVPRCGGAQAPPRAATPWSSTSTPRWWRSTRRTRRHRPHLQGWLRLPPHALFRRRHRGGAGGAAAPGATPGPTPSSTTSWCSTPPWPSCRRRCQRERDRTETGTDVYAFSFQLSANQAPDCSGVTATPRRCGPRTAACAPCASVGPPTPTGPRPPWRSRV